MRIGGAYAQFVFVFWGGISVQTMKMMALRYTIPNCDEEDDDTHGWVGPHAACAG